jgi:predicted  nucleic acid-binding Zn-ribbon protein
MWEKLFTLAQNILTLGKELEQNRADMKEMRRDLTNLTLLVQRLSDEIKLSSQREAGEREKLVLRLENELLKFEKRLLPAKEQTGKKRSTKSSSDA